MRSTDFGVRETWLWTSSLSSPVMQPCFHPTSVHWALYHGPCTALCTEDQQKARKARLKHEERVNFKEVWWVLWWWRTQCGGSISEASAEAGWGRGPSFSSTPSHPFPIDPVRSPYEIPSSLLFFSIPTTRFIQSKYSRQLVLAGMRRGFLDLFLIHLPALWSVS